MAIAVSAMNGAETMARMIENDRSSIRLTNRVTRDARKPSEKISQLGFRSSIRIFPVSRS